MRKVKKNIVKKQTGITIIALVITIVVLLILAGITIGAITGNNGIIGQTQTAKTNTEREQIREQIDVMVVQSIGKNGNVDKEVLMPKLETLPDGKEIYDTDEEIYIVYPEYTFKVDLGSGHVSIEDVEISKDETPWELAGSGTKEDPYLIESIEDLVSFSNDVNEGNSYSNKYVKLTKTLDFKSPLSYNNPKTKVSEKTTRIIKEDTNGEEIQTFLIKEDGTGFNPIGNSSNGFRGTFDGNGKEIKNIYINRPNEDNIGVFAKVSGEIKSIGVLGRINGGGDCLSGLVGETESRAKISACYSDINFTIVGNAMDSIGGIVGYNRGEIINCYSNGNINGNLSNDTTSHKGIGGVCGSNSNIISNCYNKLSFDIYVSGSPWNLGGISGINDQLVENTYNINNLSINKNAYNLYSIGGIVALNFGDIKDNYNNGYLSEDGYFSGAIVGYEQGNDLIITNNYYLKGTAEGGIDGEDIEGQAMPLEASEMPSVLEVVSTGNEKVEWNGQMVDVWKEDTNNINNGYPILFWQ